GRRAARCLERAAAPGASVEDAIRELSLGASAEVRHVELARGLERLERGPGVHLALDRQTVHARDDVTGLEVYCLPEARGAQLDDRPAAKTPGVEARLDLHALEEAAEARVDDARHLGATERGARRRGRRGLSLGGGRCRRRRGRGGRRRGTTCAGSEGSS